MNVIIAFYKVNKKSDKIDRLINWWTGKNGYSHTEIFIPETMKRYTSSGRVGGVVKRDIKSLKGFYKNNDNTWDYVEINIDCLTIEKIEEFYYNTKNNKYDFKGIFGFILPIQDRQNKWFCSEWVSTVLKNNGCKKLSKLEPSRISPNELYEILKG